MATLLASHPCIPYLGEFPGGLYPGAIIRIDGQMLHCDSFVVDIKTSPVQHPCDNINLHLSVRPNEDSIVRSHMTHHVWGHEERYGGCPIGYGQHFKILIFAGIDQFKVAVNGHHFCEFLHRIPLAVARFIQIDGGVEIFSITLEGYPACH